MKILKNFVDKYYFYIICVLLLLFCFKSCQSCNRKTQLNYCKVLSTNKIDSLNYELKLQKDSIYVLKNEIVNLNNTVEIINNERINQNDINKKLLKQNSDIIKIYKTNK